MNFRDSNEYEVRFTEDEQDLEQLSGPADDRDQVEPEFEVDEELAYNLDVGEADPAL